MWTTSKDFCDLIHQGSPDSFPAQVHAIHETQQRYNGLTKIDDKMSAYCKQTYWVLDGFGFWFGPQQSWSNCNDCSVTSCSWRTTTESCRYCSSYSRCTSTCQRALEWRDVQTSPCTTQQCKTTTAEIGIPFEWQFVSFDFCESSRQIRHKINETHWQASWHIVVEHLLNTTCKSSDISFWRCSAHLEQQ